MFHKKPKIRRTVLSPGEVSLIDQLLREESSPMAQNLRLWLYGSKLNRIVIEEDD